jgi:hypothetical protein
LTFLIEPKTAKEWAEEVLSNLPEEQQTPNKTWRDFYVDHGEKNYFRLTALGDYYCSLHYQFSELDSNITPATNTKTMKLFNRKLTVPYFVDKKSGKIKIRVFCREFACFIILSNDFENFLRDK